MVGRGVTEVSPLSSPSSASARDVDKQQQQQQESNDNDNDGWHSYLLFTWNI
jgi:hypothetical protein